MAIDPNALLTAALGLAGVPLGSWLTSRGTARADASAEREALGAQFEAMVLAVAELRAAAEADHVLWSNPWETVRVILLASMTALGPAAFAKETDHRQLAAGLGAAGWFLARERSQAKAATASFVPRLAAVAAAAAPLMRHPDAGIREGAEHFMAAVFSYHESRNATALEVAAADFGSAVRAVLYPAPRRLLRRRRWS